jgi:glucuronate isomerase
MSQSLRERLYDELSAVELIDAHTHINALQPASRTLADILGYHYYTELAHSAGMPRADIEQPGLDSKQKVGRLVERMSSLQNTIQYSWLVEMAQAFFGFQAETVTRENWESLYDRAQRLMSDENWPETVLRKTKLAGVVLTNDFDDPLQGFDTNIYIPCLRTDDLVFHFGQASVRRRLASSTGLEVGNA